MRDRHVRRPRVLCSTVSLFGRSLDDAFAMLSTTGFAGVEVMVTKDPDTRDPERLRDLAEHHGLPIVAIHAPFLLMTRTVWGRDPVGKISRAVELAAAVGAELVVVHPPYRWQVGYRRWALDRLPALEEQAGLRVAVENMFPIRVRGKAVAALHSTQSLEDLLAFAHVVLDTSHAAVAGLDLTESVQTLRDRLEHVHLSNNTGKGWDSHLPLDRGVLDLDAFLRMLAAERFGGTISLELDLRRYASDDEELARVLGRDREFCESRLALPA